MASAPAWANRCAARGAFRHPRGAVGSLLPACCDSTTYVRDRAPASRLAGMHRCSSAPGIGRRDAARHNSQAGYKRERKEFCCVTTRPGHRPDAPPAPLLARRWLNAHKTFPHGVGIAAPAPPPHAIDELPASDAAVAVAWPPANDAQASGTPGLGNTAGSTAGPDRPAYTLDAGRSAGQDADR
jgi:hypothetical protein